ncbi:MAG: hypothetical protein JNL71_10045 [Rhodospirillales bacterium]|nr:hypothetical protein [Rhodospirillales bacterium]
MLRPFIQHRPLPRAADMPAGVTNGAELGEHIVVDLGTPLSAFDRPGAKAYAAIDRRFPDGQHLAFVCEPDRSVRIRAAQRQRGLSRSGLLSLLDAGVLKRSGSGDAYAFVYEKPVGPTPPRRMWGGWAPRTLIQNFLKPICVALAEIVERGEIHGSIRPDNVFSQDTKGQLFALGPCVLGPVGYDQPAPFEPIERALASPDGKGIGGSIDDMFGLGMTLYCFATGKYPGEGQQPDALMARRLAYGSTSAMIDTSQIPSELFDPIMALIDDDVKTRWSLAAITDWTNGRRPQIPSKRPAARRGSPLQIGPVQCLEARELAFAIHKYPDPAATALERGEIANWLKANDIQLALALNIDDSGSPTPLLTSKEVLLGREAVRLDPVGPIRYRDLSFFPNGAGAVMYAALLDGGKRQQFEELFSARLVHLWAKAANPLGLVDEPAKELLDLEDRVSNGLEKLESALYKLNPDAPCLSPEVQGRWVDTLGDLLDVFEAGLARGNFEPDAHIVAFLGARGGITPADLGALRTFDGKDPRRAAAILKLGVRIVVEAKGKQLPNLTNICHSAARALIGRLRNPAVREQTLAKADAAAASFDIQGLADIATDPEIFGADNAEFARAKHEYDANQRILDMRDSIVETTARMGSEKGQEIALMILSGLAVMTVLFQLFTQIGKVGS